MKDGGAGAGQVRLGERRSRERRAMDGPAGLRAEQGLRSEEAGLELESEL